MPLLEAMGQNTIRIGDLSQAANLVKLSCNFLIASLLEALSEAMALIGKAGIDQHRYYELLTSTLFAGPVCRKLREAESLGRSISLRRLPQS